MASMPVTTARKKEIDGSLTDDLLVTEEPLEIRLGYGPVDSRNEERIAVTMRTPGDDHKLALGFLFSEGIISNFQDVLRVEHCQQVKPEEKGNVIRIELAPGIKVDEAVWKRNFYMSSSCGVCGKSSIESVKVTCSRISRSSKLPSQELLVSLPDRMRSSQVVFEHTGGIHAASLFDMVGNGLFVFEDIGRHNAVDKVIGAGLENPEVFKKAILVVSGRAGFELVQKCCVAGIPVMLAVGAPSSLAVQLAEEQNLVLYGFARKGSLNRYTNLEQDG